MKKLNLTDKLYLIEPQELLVIANDIKDGDVIFDVGAHYGEWSSIALNNYKSLTVHFFEAVPQTFKILLKKMGNYKENIIFNNFAISNIIGDRPFYFYEDRPGLSGYHRRSEETENNIIHTTPKILKSIPTETLDNYCRFRKIDKINILKIDTEGADFDVVKGAKRLIEEGKIDAIEFEYGGCWQENGTKLEDIYNFLTERNYEVFKTSKEGFISLPKFTKEMEDYNYSMFLARRIR